MPGIGKNRGRDAGRSRNTTPMSTASTEQGSSARLATPVAASWNDLLDLPKNGGTPHSSKLKNILESIKHFNTLAAEHVDLHDKGMRECARRKKEELERQHEMMLKARAEEEETERLRQAAIRRKEQEDRAPALGAHSLAPQDGSTNQVHSDQDDIEMKEASSEAADEYPQSFKMAKSTTSTPEPKQPRPAPAIHRFQTFGPDPSKFDDPTIYHIRDWDASTSEEEKKQILGVIGYPEHDLRDLTAGDPPDRDLHNAKPSQQITWPVYSSWLEPYFRQLTEEDINFLKERGDRSGPMVIPPRGQRSYKEIWADEDNSGYGDPLSSTISINGINGMGSMETLTADMSDSTEQSGPGPVLARLMQTLRPERRAPLADTTAGETANGDATMTGLDAEDSIFETVPFPANDDTQQPAQRPLPVATLLPDFANIRPPLTRPSAEDLDERVLRELRYIGFLSDEKPDFNGHHDDEIAGRLRSLQSELQKVSVGNGARKAKVLEMVGDEMARQEWTGIRDDLDSQLNAAYSKRHRTTSKSKGKLKRTGAAAAYGGASSGGGDGRTRIGEPIKLLMDRRNQWMNYLGPAVEFGKREVPETSVFSEEDPKMLALIAAEKEHWGDAQDGS